MSNGILLHRCHNQERKSRFLFGQPAFGNVCPKATKLKEVAVQELHGKDEPERQNGLLLLTV
jgi:hypothetical protein